MKKTPLLLCYVYAVFLVATGILGYRLGPMHASISLVGGVGGGILVAALSLLNSRKILWAYMALRTAVSVFALSFAWRAADAWKLVFAGSPEHSAIASLLSVMCVVSLAMVLNLLKNR